MDDIYIKLNILDYVNNFCKVAIDVGKLAFASMVLGSIISTGIDKIFLIVFGLIGSLLLIVIGILLTQPNEEED
jgi:putative Mn2+ efflux pump MntP